MTANDIGYYVNQPFLLTRSGIKTAIVGTVICFIMIYLAFAFVGGLTDGITKNIDINKFKEESREEWKKSINNINTSTHPSVWHMAITSIVCGVMAGLILSKTDVVLRMNYLKQKYNCDTWNDVTLHLRGMGMTYPWWDNELFWEESNEFRKLYRQPSDIEPTPNEDTEKQTYDPNFGQL